MVEAHALRLGRVAGDHDNELKIDGRRFTALELLNERTTLFVQACRGLLALTQAESEPIEVEVHNDTSADRWLSFFGVIIGAALAFSGALYLQRRRRYWARIMAMKERVLDAVSAGNGWVAAFGADPGGEATKKSKGEALSAGRSLLAALHIAKSDPLFLGRAKGIDDLYRRAEKSFGVNGHIPDNEPEEAKDELTNLRDAADDVLKPPRLLRSLSG